MTIPARFEIGDKIYTASWDTEQREHPCPDCLGTGKWQITTPAGSTLTANCQRCDRYNHDLPSLKYSALVASVREYTITGMRVSIDSEPEYHSGCRSSYTSIKECEAFASREAALAAAEAIVNEHNAKALALPDATVGKHLASMRYEDARFNEFKNGLYEAYSAYRRLLSDIEECVSDEFPDDEVNKEKLSEIIRWEKRHRDKSFLEELVCAAEEDAADGSASDGLKKALANMPVFARSALAGVPLEEIPA